MIHIIQENLFKEHHYDLLINTIKRYQLPHVMVRVFPFVDSMVNIDDIPDVFNNVEDLPQIEVDNTQPIFCWGSLKMSRIAQERNWKPGVLFNENFDYKVYSKWWSGLLLNEDSEIYKIDDHLPWERGDLFLRPTADSKAFTGAIFDKEKWENTKKNYLDTSDYPAFNREADIQVSTPKLIQKEIRLWVVNKKIITGSYYRLGGKTYLNSDIEPDALEFGKTVIGKGCLADAFVLDICMSNGEWKVVEAGCINHAGFYASEINKTLEAIEDFFNK